MANNITILYYSACLISQTFQQNIINHLLEVTKNQYPIISITQKPVNLGENILFEGIPSVYNIYKQILIGAKAANTKYIACCEDDCLYTTDYFEHQTTADDIFGYNTNHWNCDYRFFFFRERNNMCMCVSPRELVVETLELRFKKYPNIMPKEQLRGFGEPGRYEPFLGLPRVKRESFNTKIPCVTFNHRPSMGGMRKVLSQHKISESLEYWGKAEDLRKKLMG